MRPLGTNSTAKKKKTRRTFNIRQKWLQKIKVKQRLNILIVHFWPAVMRPNRFWPERCPDKIARVDMAVSAANFRDRSCSVTIWLASSTVICWSPNYIGSSFGRLDASSTSCSIAGEYFNTAAEAEAAHAMLMMNEICLHIVLRWISSTQNSSTTSFNAFFSIDIYKCFQCFALLRKSNLDKQMLNERSLFIEITQIIFAYYLN